MPSSSTIIPDPKPPLWRRGAALGIDCMTAGLISSMIGGGLIIWTVSFMLIWMGLRVVVTAFNQGQTLGRWAFNITVIESGSGETPQLSALSKREGLAGLGCVLALIGATHISPMSPTAPLSLLLSCPLLADCGLALTNPALQQAFHDRIAHTQVVRSQRGYSLDHKLKKWFAYVKHRMRQ